MAYGEVLFIPFFVFYVISRLEIIPYVDVRVVACSFNSRCISIFFDVFGDDDRVGYCCSIARRYVTFLCCFHV